LAIQNTNTVTPKILLLNCLSLLVSNKTLVTKPWLRPITIKISNKEKDGSTALGTLINAK
jgi:hypothetical protein